MSFKHESRQQVKINFNLAFNEMELTKELVNPKNFISHSTVFKKDLKLCNWFFALI